MPGKHSQIPWTTHLLVEPRQVLKVPPTNPLAWQTSLIDSEVDSILGGGIYGHTKEGRHVGDAHGGSGGGDRTADNNGIPPAGRQHREFLRRGGGRTSAGGKDGSKEGGGDGDRGGGQGTEGGGTRRLDIVPGEVCPVCQEEMQEEGGGDVDHPPIETAAATAAEGRLTFCRDGCGNNMHARWVVGGLVGEWEGPSLRTLARRNTLSIKFGLVFMTYYCHRYSTLLFKICIVAGTVGRTSKLKQHGYKILLHKRPVFLAYEL